MTVLVPTLLPMGATGGGKQEESEASDDPSLKTVYKQWSTNTSRRLFTPAADTVPTLVPGLYTAVVTNEGQVFFDRLPLHTADLIDLPDSSTGEIVRDIQKFWQLTEVFDKFGLVHRRGIMMHGPPGTGKSSTIRLVLRDVIAAGGIGLEFTSPDVYARAMRTFREIQPLTPVVVLMEDVEEVMRRWESKLLNILDGAEKIEHVVYLASTNVPEQLGDRLTNRPSRFDRRYLIDTPTPAARRVYLETIRKGVDIPVAEWVDKTDGLSIAHIKEIFISNVLFGKPFSEALAQVKGMSKMPRRDKRDSAPMGFNPIEEMMVGMITQGQEGQEG